MSCMKNDFSHQVFVLLSNPTVFNDFSFYSNIKSFTALLGHVDFKSSTDFSDTSILYLLALALFNP